MSHPSPTRAHAPAARLRALLRVACFGVSLLTLLLATAEAQSFAATGLQGAALNNPTSLQFGPDGRLYVSQQDGLIRAFTIAQSGGAYSVTATENIAVVKQVLNHQDYDGSIYTGAAERQVTGILAAGTAAQPVLYVTSSDYRIGGGGGGSDLDLDTNSGILHRLTKAGGAWQRLDLVRGLPRSEENHASNGMQLSPDGQTLFLAQGGHTNAGAPSNNFAFTTEYALAAAVLTIDLAAVDALPTKTWGEDGSQYKYDLPTLDDPTRPNTGPGGADVGDPFGGNDGLNQAKLVAGGPVQVYAPGFRNLYDLVLTQDGRLYGWDNGPNGGWGGHPANEGVGTATNDWLSGEPGSVGPGPNDPQVNNKDGLHFITGPGYYGGHPCPVRANPSGAGLFTQSGGGGGPAGVWRTSTSGANPLPSDWPPVPASLANPVEGDYQNPGETDPSLYTVTSSTNGMCEYTSTANGGALRGDLLAASFNGKLYRIRRNAQGGINGPGDVTVLAENFGSVPLDVTAQGDGEVFAGTIWCATYGADNVTVFTPTGTTGCQAPNSGTVDTDGDGYSNADEYANGVNPCSQASTPPDADGTLIGGFLVSDLNDPDDDDDGLPDTTDPFALDASNGQATPLPLDLPLLNGDPGTGFYGVGFTGLMTNGQDYLLNVADEDNSATEIIAGGAVGLFTINNAGAGDAYNAFNALKNGFQVGFPLTQASPVTVLETKLLGPLWPGTPQNFQQAGFALSDGSQANYLKLVAIASGGPKVQVQYQENDASVDGGNYVVSGLETASEIVLQLIVDPATGSVQPRIKLGNAAVQDVGPAVQLAGNLLAAVQGSAAPAVGLLTTSGQGGVTMSATWDYVRVTPQGGAGLGQWATIDGQGACSPLGQSGSCAQGRHEASYVQVGRKFYLLGGRENGSNVNVYDPAADTWTTGASPGFPVHHFQAVAFDGLIYAIGIFEDNDFPNEQPYDQVLVYDPARDRWFDGPPIPSARVRASSGCVAYQGKLYLVGGITNGHSSGWSNKLDAYDPATGQWTALANLPRARDHFHAAVHQGKLYVVGGRRSGQNGTFLPTIGAVDVYDFASDTWSTLPNNLPTQRAAAGVAVLGGELLVIGGERDAGAANDEVEALDLASQQWRSLAPLSEGRHGTQAIVNNGAVYVASGSPNRGGGSTRTQERFTFSGGTPAVTGPTLAAAQVSAPGTVSWPAMSAGQAQNRPVALSHAGGNQGAVVESVSVAGADFSVVGGAAAWTGRLIRPGATQTVTVRYTQSGTAAASGTLTVVTSAAAQPISIALSAPGSSGGGGGSQELHINAGGPAVTAGGIAYQADQYFGSPSSTSNSGAGVNIGGTTADAVYQTHRWHNGDLAYAIPLGSGTYDVTLRFAETYFASTGGGASGPGQRVFSVDLEGQRVLTDFDVNAVTGSTSPVAVDRTFTVTVADGALDLDFVQGGANNPFVAAISIVPTGGGGGGPQLSLSPGSVAFQTQAVGSTSPEVPVDVVNVGTQAATVASVSISGPEAAAFAKTGIAAGSTVPAGGSNNFRVTFSPASQQPAVQQATLTLTFQGGVPSLSLPLTGEAQQSGGGGGGGGGSGPDLELTAAALDPDPGQWTIARGSFTLTNAGTVAASGIAVRMRLPADVVFEGGNEATVSQGTFDPYTNSTWTVGSLAAGASATIDYRVFYMAGGARQLDAWVSAQGGPADRDSSPSAQPDGEDDASCFEFNGSGACSSSGGGGGGGGGGQAVLAVAPASVSFPATAAGQTASQQVTIANGGTADATVASRGYAGGQTGAFGFGGLPVGTVVPAGGSVTFTLRYQPPSGSSGAQSSAFVVGFGGSPADLTVPVSGSVQTGGGGGGQAVVSVSPGSVTFPATATGQTATQQVILSNSGTAAATVASRGYVGGQPSAFNWASLPVGATVPAGGSLSFELRYSPGQTSGTQASTFVVGFGGSPADLSIPVSGTVQTGGGGGGGGGGGSGPDLELTATASQGNPAQWTIGVGTFTLTNAGTAAADAIEVRLRLPANLVYEGGNEATTTQGSFDPYTGGIWSVGRLAAGASASITYRVFNMAAAAQRVDAWVSAQSGTDQDSSPSAQPDGEDDATCYEFNGSGACPANGGGGGGGGGGNVPAGFLAEAGSLSVATGSAGEWTALSFQQSYANPVVLIHLGTDNGPAPAHARVRAITGAGCEVQVDEWEYDDGAHAAETVYYVVVEAGTYDFGGGRIWVATTTTAGASWQAVSGAPGGTYSVFATQASDNDPRACVVRQRRTAGGGVELHLRNEEAEPNNHAPEQVHVLMVSAGSGQLDGAPWEAVYSADDLTHADRAFVYASGFAAAPVLLADVQSYDGGDPCHLRTKSPTATGFTGFAEEETSADAETNHTTERAGYFAVGAGVWGAGTTASLAGGAFQAVPHERRVETYWGVDPADARDRRYVVERALGEAGEAWRTLGERRLGDARVLSLDDPAPELGVNRYRLRTVYADGSYVLSRERRVAFAFDRAAVAVYPNPSRDGAFAVHVPRITAHPVELRVVDALGQTVAARVVADPAVEVTRFAERLPPGAYRVYVRVGGMRVARGLIVGD